jgi:hypothetical protein
LKIFKSKGWNVSTGQPAEAGSKEAALASRKDEVTRRDGCAATKTKTLEQGRLDGTSAARTRETEKKNVSNPTYATN